MFYKEEGIHAKGEDELDSVLSMWFWLQRQKEQKMKGDLDLFSMVSESFRGHACESDHEGLKGHYMKLWKVKLLCQW